MLRQPSSTVFWKVMILPERKLYCLLHLAVVGLEKQWMD